MQAFAVHNVLMFSHTPFRFSPTIRPRLLLTLVAAGLSGCAAIGPDYVPPVADVPTSWSRLDSSPAPIAHAGALGDLGRWWEGLHDPLLVELIEDALRGSPDLRSAQASVRAARARRTVAAAAGLPSVTASGSARRGTSSEETGSGETRTLFQAGFDANWEVDVFGGARRGVEAAEADLAAAEASLDNTRASLAAEVALNYIDVRAQQARLAIARANLASQSETLQLTEWRAQAGLVSTQDVEQARSNREQTRAQLPALETLLAEAEHTLDILLGKPPGTLHARLASGGALPDVPTQLAVGIPAATLRQRPDVRAAERTLAAETARVGVAEAARYPAFTLSGSIGLEALTFNALDNSSALASSLLAGVAAPIFNAGRLRAQVDIQDAARERALAAYAQTVLGALREVENALVALARSRDRVDALSRGGDAARSAAVLAQQRYRAGLIDFQSVLDSERSVLAFEDSLANARADSARALIRLYKALGGGWSAAAEPSPPPKDTP